MERFLITAVLLPLAAAFFAFLLPADKPKAIRALAIFATGVSLLLTLYIFSQFDRTKSGYQFVRGIEWLPSLGITLKFGVDGIYVDCWNPSSCMVEDHGCGFDLNLLSSKSAAGISGMKERAQLLGGTLVIKTSPGAGTYLTAELPLNGSTLRPEY